MPLWWYTPRKTNVRVCHVKNIAEKKRKPVRLIVVLCLISLLLAACGAEKSAEQPKPSPSPAETASPTAAPSALAIDIPKASEDPLDISEYIGRYMNDGFDTVLVDISDEGFSMTVSLYRLISLDEGTISADAGGIGFHTLDAAGEPMTVSLYRDGEGYALRVDESTWPPLEQGTVISGFRRTALEQLEAGYAAADGGADGPIDPAKASDAPQGHYVFQPKVCSVYMEEIFGKDMCEAWYNLVDAVMAGENTFACKDQHTYDWTMGQFRERCFPILTELVDYAYDREHSVIDGVASFTWLVPPEEAAARIAEFGTQVEGILNEALEDDYSDLEKALSLYLYFSEHYEYDYETYMKMWEEYVDYTSSYRFFKTGVGICHEISTVYSYLLMQAGVEATIMMGGDHQWSYVRINGHNYHIDPTFVLSRKGSLAYFMMTDEQRDLDGFSRKKYTITSNYSQDHAHPDYAANDDTFRPLWDKDFESFSHETNTILCRMETGDYGEWTEFEFDYSGY